MRHTAALLTAALLLAVTGCSSDDESPGKQTVTKASPTPSPASPSPSPSPSEDTFKVGDTADIEADGFKFSAAVLDYTDKGVTGVPELLSEGQKWAVAMVKVCNAGDEAFGVTPFPWSLAYADGVRVEAAGMNAGDLPQPLYPMDARVKGGDCVKGNIVFTVPKAGRAERVLYSPGDLAEPVEWQVGK